MQRLRGFTVGTGSGISSRSACIPVSYTHLDLLDLDQKGQLKRVFGGAIPLEKPVINFFDRETADIALKQQDVYKRQALLV